MKYGYICVATACISLCLFFFGVPLIGYLTKYSDYNYQRRWVSTGDCTTNLVLLKQINSNEWLLILNITSTNNGIPTQAFKINCTGVLTVCFAQNGVNQTRFCFYDRRVSIYGGYQEFVRNYQTTVPSLWGDLFETYVIIISILIGIAAVITVSIIAGNRWFPHEMAVLSERVLLLSLKTSVQH